MAGDLLWLPLIGACVVGMMLLVYKGKNSARNWRGIFTQREPERTPLEDLQIRYLRGEIDWKEYEAEQRKLAADD